MNRRLVERLPAGVGWLTGLAVVVVVAINLAGIGGIALARRGVLRDDERILRLETTARAHELESMLASLRADLAFLTGSPIFFGLENALESRDPAFRRFRRLEAEGSLLIFLRGHPEVTGLQVRTRDEGILLQAGRRGGVPVLWVSGIENPAGHAPRAVDRARRPISARFAFTVGERSVHGAVSLDAIVDASRILVGPAGGADRRSCALLDGDGVMLGTDRGGDGGRIEEPDPRGAPEFINASAPVATEGWSVPSPWTLVCGRRRSEALARLEPMAGSYRATLILNLAAMTLALLLGAFAVQQARRRMSLEERTREEARVRELERRLFHAERLGTVGRLAAGIAHELNNPLEGMSNYLGLLRDDLQRGDAAAARRRLASVQEGLDRAVGVVRQVLAHADPATAPRAVLDLNDILRQEVGFVSARPEFRHISFVLELEGAPLMVRGRPAPLGQVFLNLLLNACEAQPSSGEVRVASRREDARAAVSIADRGPGVPSGEAARIFEPFYSTKESTGLGLSICYSIAADHGGTLTFQERPGGGALFRLEIPLAEETHD